MKKLGIIGGMGPSATALFYEMIIANTSASVDQDHIPMVIINDAQMPDRTKAILGSDADKEKVYSKLLADALYLKQGGCDAIAIPCNTSHYFADKLESESGLKLFNMIRLTANAAKKANAKQVAILATDGTVKTKLYQKALETEGLKVWTPADEIQKEVMSVIYDDVKAGHDVSKDKWNKIEQAALNAGCDYIILACTELSVVYKDLGLGEKYIDAMSVMAKACVADFKK